MPRRPRGRALRPTSHLPHVDGEQRGDVGAVRVLVQDPVAAVGKTREVSLVSHTLPPDPQLPPQPPGLCSSHQRVALSSHVTRWVLSISLPSSSWAANRPQHLLHGALAAAAPDPQPT